MERHFVHIAATVDLMDGHIIVGGFSCHAAIATAAFAENPHDVGAHGRHCIHGHTFGDRAGVACAIGGRNEHVNRAACGRNGPARNGYRPVASAVNGGIIGLVKGRQGHG